MFDDFISLFLPQFAKTISYLAIFMIGFQLVDTSSGRPVVNGLWTARLDSLILLGGGALFMLFVAEPLIEKAILMLLYQYIEYAFSILLLAGGLAILKFNQTMKWDYSKYGYILIVAGIFLSALS